MPVDMKRNNGNIQTVGKTKQEIPITVKPFFACIQKRIDAAAKEQARKNKKARAVLDRSEKMKAGKQRKLDSFKLVAAIEENVSQKDSSCTTSPHINIFPEEKRDDGTEQGTRGEDVILELATAEEGSGQMFFELLKILLAKENEKEQSMEEMKNRECINQDENREDIASTTSSEDNRPCSSGSLAPVHRHWEDDNSVDRNDEIGERQEEMESGGWSEVVIMTTAPPESSNCRKGRQQFEAVSEEGINCAEEQLGILPAERVASRDGLDTNRIRRARDPADVAEEPPAKRRRLAETRDGRRQWGLFNASSEVPNELLTRRVIVDFLLTHEMRDYNPFDIEILKKIQMHHDPKRFFELFDIATSSQLNQDLQKFMEKGFFPDTTINNSWIDKVPTGDSLALASLYCAVVKILEQEGRSSRITSAGLFVTTDSAGTETYRQLDLEALCSEKHERITKQAVITINKDGRKRLRQLSRNIVDKTFWQMPTTQN